MPKEVKARAHTWYEVDYEKGTIKFLRRICPRCGSVMAYHKVPVLDGLVASAAIRYLSRLGPDKR